MARRLELTRAAEGDLIDLHRYGTFAFGAARADTYLADMLGVLDDILLWPEAAQLRTEIRPPIRMRPWASHLIFSDVTPDAVVIVRVLHGHADWQSGL